MKLTQSPIWTREVVRNGTPLKLSIAEQHVPSLRNRINTKLRSFFGKNEKPPVWEKIAGSVWEQRAIKNAAGNTVLQRRSIAQRTTWLQQKITKAKEHVDNLARVVKNVSAACENSLDSLSYTRQSLRAKFAPIVAGLTAVGVMAGNENFSYSQANQRPATRPLSRVSDTLQSGSPIVATVAAPSAPGKCPKTELDPAKAKRFPHVEQALQDTGCAIWTGNTLKDAELRKQGYKELFIRLRAKYPAQELSQLKNGTFRAAKALYRVLTEDMGMSPRSAGLLLARLEKDYPNFNVDVWGADESISRHTDGSVSGKHRGKAFTVLDPLNEGPFTHTGEENMPEGEQPSFDRAAVTMEALNTPQASHREDNSQRDFAFDLLESKIALLQKKYDALLFRLSPDNRFIFSELGGVLSENRVLLTQLRAYKSGQAASIAQGMEELLEDNLSMRRFFLKGLTDDETDKIQSIQDELIEIARQVSRIQGQLNENAL